MERGGIVTKIEVQKRRQNRRSIFIDDRYSFGLDEEIVIKNDVKVGQTLDDTKIETLLLKEEEKKAREHALNLLSYRDRSCREVRDRLKGKGYDPQIIDRVVVSLQQTLLLNDERFAREWSRERLKSRPMGAKLLRQELQKKGIPSPIVDQTIEDLYTARDEKQLAVRALGSRKNRYRTLDQPKAQKRLADFLLRRGFSWDVVQEIVSETKINS